MKKYIIAFLMLPLLSACEGNHSTNDKATGKEEESALTKLSHATKAIKSLAGSGKNMEKLQKMTPLTNNQFKAWLPEEVSGMKRISYSAGAAGMVDISSLSAAFSAPDKSKKLEVSIIDGAGKTGSAVVSLIRMELSQDFEREDQDQVERTVEHNGHKAILTYDKSNKTTEIQFLENGRFCITVTGKNMTTNEVWEAIGNLNTDELG